MTAKNGFSLIPIGAKVAAALVFLAIVAGLNRFFVVPKHLGPCGGRISNRHQCNGRPLCGGLCAARRLRIRRRIRRGMQAIAWTAPDRAGAECDRLRALLPASKTDRAPCPNCGCGVAQDAAFCSRCGQSQLNAEVQHSWKES